MMRIVLYIFCVLVAASAHSPGQAGKYEKLEETALQKIREIWTTAAQSDVKGEHTHLLIRAIDEARRAGGSGDELDVAESKLMMRRNQGAAADHAAADEILLKAISDVRDAVMPLLSLEPPAGSASLRYLDHLTRALSADPKNTKLIANFQKRALAAYSKKDWDTLRAYLKRSGFADPEGTRLGKYRASEQGLQQQEGAIVVQSPVHLMESFVVLPEGWTSKKKWPMFVAIVGANCAYKSMLDELLTAGKKKPFILVVMKTIANGNELPIEKLPYPESIMKRYAENSWREQRIVWDEIGMLSNLAEIRQRFNGEDRFFMTGYSGGGFLLYYWLLHHPNQLTGACAGSANYWPLIEHGKTTPENGGCPVLITTGSLDSAGQERIFPQSEEATRKLKDFGYSTVEYRHLKGRDHEPFYELGLEFFEKLLRDPKTK